MFRPSDERRVQAVLDATLPAPFEATLTLTDQRRTMTVTILDPDDAALTVASAVWWFDDRVKGRAQPSPAELTSIADSFALICNDYPAKKAAEAQGA